MTELDYLYTISDKLDSIITVLSQFSYLLLPLMGIDIAILFCIMFYIVRRNRGK